MKNAMMALLMFVGLAAGASGLMAQCGGCEKGAKAEKTAKDCGNCEDCAGCEGCEKSTVKTGATFEVSVTGLDCEKCSAKVKKTLAALENVAEVKVCHKSGKAWVTVKEGKSLTKEECEKALKDTAFKVTACAEMKKAEKSDKTEEKKDGVKG
jgi:copper chaperone CopZ